MKNRTRQPAGTGKQTSGPRTGERRGHGSRRRSLGRSREPGEWAKINFRFHQWQDQPFSGNNLTC